jgi:CDP-diacylglycerol--glycerol-3-phosphate 3-phosphatidyltransferase
LIYITCGASDFADGYIARATKNTSKFGAAFDSIADLIFITVILYILIPIISLPTSVSIWIVGIAAIRIVSLLVGYVKYKAFASLHTYGNKATGLILFIYPFIYKVFGITQIILIVASLSALEELIINIKAKELNANIKSIFIR